MESNSDWLNEVLDEVGLKQFYPKLTNDLQLTKLSHFDFVSEEDLIQLGLSKPAARRLLAAIKKRKSFVTALKNTIVNKLIPASSSALNFGNKNKLQFQPGLSNAPTAEDSNPTHGQPTCLINSKDIQVKEEIGHGVHGFVKKGEWTSPNGRVIEVALKILRKDVMSEPGASFNEFVKEISVMHQLNHPNIIKLYGVVLSSPMMMVTELAPFGNLRDKLRLESGSTPISQLINFGVQIASGMQYLESKRFVHRDLAARNIFISHGKRILIGDLGLMRAIPSQENHYVMNEKTKIPYPWCAPESLKYRQFSSFSDVYMFGVTLWEMFSFGQEPWAKLGLNEILENISSQKRRLPCPEACPAVVYQTLLQCWNTEPSCRPNFSTLYQYLSTSYPLEVRAIERIIEDGSSSFIKPQRNGPFKILSCELDDRILVIDGQPENFWWKGQNQRTFEIGGFPLNSTRWLAPKKGTNYISKPLKNSFVHTGHCGRNGKWGNPQFIDRMYLKNPLVLDDMDKISVSRHSRISQQSLVPKNKTKSRLSRFFGINDASHASHLLNSSYQKFHNNVSKFNTKSDFISSSLVRSQSDEINPTEKTDDGPLLIDFNDDIVLSSENNTTAKELVGQTQQPSLIDMDTSFSTIPEVVRRGASDTRLNEMDDNYHLSWAGSWNTGTFDGSNGDIYSAYYCPQDAAAATSSGRAEADANRYYSAVSYEDNRSSLE